MKSIISKVSLFSSLLLFSLAAACSSSKEDTGESGNGVKCGLGGNGDEACTSCISSNCASLTEECSASGGPCSSYMECASKCDCDDTSCTSECGQPSSACTTCLGKSSECIKDKCESECSGGGGGDAGSGGGAGAQVKECKDLKKCIDRIPANYPSSKKLYEEWYNEDIASSDPANPCKRHYDMCNRRFPE